jgi:hypothetical protein
MKRWMCAFVCLVSFFGLGQNKAITPQTEDSLERHSPKKAVIYSAILPGAGQIYNHINMPKGKRKAFWKLPLFYTGLSATSYFLVQNQNNQLSLRKEYQNRQDGNPLNPAWSIYDDAGVLTLYNQYLNKRDLSILGLAATYLLQIVDAGIEAHFVNFDISKDVSLSIQPAWLHSNTYGMRLKFSFQH